MQSRIPYDFAGSSAENVFFIRHYGSGSKGILPGYIRKRMYPNNLAIFTSFGKPFTTRFLTTFLENYEFNAERNSDTDDDGYDDDDNGGSYNAGDSLFDDRGGLKINSSYDDEKDSSGKVDLASMILSQISEDSVDDFLNGNFSSVKNSVGRSIIMWHPGVRPYDWFKDSKYGITAGSAFQLDIEDIRNKADLFYGKIIADATK